MKTLFVNLSAVVVLFFFGCQESHITDPVPDGTTNKSQIQDDYKQGTISFSRMLTDPNPVGNSYFRIGGLIEYKYRLEETNPMIPFSQRYFSLNLAITADLAYYCSVCGYSEEDQLAGFIEESSEELVPITGHFISQLDKTYAIQGRDDGMVLKARFSITTGGVELSAMWLALDKKSVKATINY